MAEEQQRRERDRNHSEKQERLMAALINHLLAALGHDVDGVSETAALTPEMVIVAAAAKRFGNMVTHVFEVGTRLITIQPLAPPRD